MSDRADRLYERWLEYHKQFCESDQYNGDETVIGAYRDWVDAVMSQQKPAFEAREGGKILRDIGITPGGEDD